MKILTEKIQIREIQKRKLKLIELLNISLSVYKKYFKFILATCTFVYIPLYIIYEFLPVYNLTLEDLININYNDIMGIAYLIVGITIIFEPLAAAAITHIGKQAVEGGQVTYTGMLDASLLKWLKHSLTALFYIVLISVSSCLIIAPLYLSVVFSFSTYIVAITNKWGFEALMKSRNIVRGNWFSTFIILAFSTLMTTIVKIAIGMVLISESNIFGSVINVLVSVGIEILTSYFVVFTILYFLNLYYLSQKKQNIDMIL